jgi:hypothetical protein
MCLLARRNVLPEQAQLSRPFQRVGDIRLAWETCCAPAAIAAPCKGSLGRSSGSGVFSGTVSSLSSTRRSDSCITPHCHLVLPPPAPAARHWWQPTYMCVWPAFSPRLRNRIIAMSERKVLHKRGPTLATSGLAAGRLCAHLPGSSRLHQDCWPVGCRNCWSSRIGRLRCSIAQWYARAYVMPGHNCAYSALRRSCTQQHGGNSVAARGKTGSVQRHWPSHCPSAFIFKHCTALLTAPGRPPAERIYAWCWLARSCPQSSKQLLNTLKRVMGCQMSLQSLTVACQLRHQRLCCQQHERWLHVLTGSICVATRICKAARALQSLCSHSAEARSRNMRQ